MPFPYRVHDLANRRKTVAFYGVCKKFGHKFDTSTPEAIAASFNQMLTDVHGKPEQHVLEQLGFAPWPKQFIQQKILVTMAWVLKTIVILLHPFGAILIYWCIVFYRKY